MIYRVYKNLRRNAFSIREKSGNVVGYSQIIIIANPKFIVNESGRQRVLKEGHKNVHAFVEGQICALNNFESRNDREVNTQHHLVSDFNFAESQCVRIYYNPYKTDKFVDANGQDANLENYKYCMLEVESGVICGYK